MLLKGFCFFTVCEPIGEGAIAREREADMTDLDEPLHAAIQRAYLVFPEFEFHGRPATVCECPSCLSVETARELAATPRASVSVELMREYLGSAHALDEGSAARELQHFLPRIFELLGAGEEVSLIGREVALTRLGPKYADYRHNWTSGQVEAVDGFFDAYWLSVLSKRSRLFQRPGTEEWLFEDDLAEATLCMIAIAGAPIERFLALWDAKRDLTADVHLAALVSNATPRAFLNVLADGHLGSAFWNFAPDAERRTADWLLDASKYGRLIESIEVALPDSPEAWALADAAEALQLVLVRRRLGR